jgi:pimeloyl-ACP methyl ester carboxylesterase
MSEEPMSRPTGPGSRGNSGPTVFLVPGLDGTALMFYRQIPLLSESFHPIAFALPNDSICTMDSLVENLLQRINRATQDQEEKVLLCGESFGRALSMSFALAFPHRLRGMVIVNSFPVIRRRFLLHFVPLALKAVPWGAMAFMRRFTESRVHCAHTLPEDLMEFRERSRAIDRTGYVRRLEILQDYDIRDSLQQIQVPTLLLAGDQDQLVPSVDEARYMADRLPRATIKILEGYGHICLNNHDLDLAEYIDPWVRGLD